jgi:hypothetical protein
MKFRRDAPTWGIFFAAKDLTFWIFLLRTLCRDAVKDFMSALACLLFFIFKLHSLNILF